MRPFSLALCLFAVPLSAQQFKQFNLVAPGIPGRVAVPPAENWKPTKIDLYDNGVRPVITLEDSAAHMTLSVILFPNHTGQPTAESCRKDVLDPILRGLESSAVVKNKKLETHITPNGVSLAVGSYLIANMSTVIDLPIQQENVFGFLGDSHTCAEMHVSKPSYTPADAVLFTSALDHFSFDGDYQPSLTDYATLGSAYYRIAKNYPAAAVYYQRALDLLSSAPAPDKTLRRFLTDQLSMSYGISGDIKRSRAVNEAAIASDPDYPLYYYNLACADAEQGKADAARAHLQQAFDRKANTLPGEHLPDPATDDSILKLKKNKDFWAFVQTLSVQSKP